VAPGTSSGLS